MAKDTCMDCKHYCHKTTVYDGLKQVSPHIYVPKEKVIGHHCKTHPEVFKKWWAENANKTREEITEVPPCLELSDFLVQLDKMKNIAQEILDKLDD